MEKKMIHIALFTPGLNNRWGLPLLFWGQPGVGKSKIIEDFAAGSGLLCHTLIASIREPSDFGGLPVPTKRGNKMYIDYTPAGWAADLEIDGDGRGVVFVDEITTCAPAVQAALLRLVLNGALGDHKLPYGIRFIAAANDTADAAGGWDLSPPLANRFGHVKWNPADAGSWTDWLIGANETTQMESLVENWDGSGEIPAPQEEKTQVFDPREEERRVLKSWAEDFAKAKGIVASFVKARPDMLHNMPKSGHAERSKAWPSPRTWELATRALGGCFVHKADDNVTNEFIEAFVGHAVASEFQTFRSNLDLPDPSDVLDGKVKFKHEPTRLDRTVAVLSSCTALVKTKKSKHREERATKLWEIIHGVSKDASDLIITPAAALVQENLGMESEHMRPVLISLKPVMRAAGVIVRS
jgi:MoxR-like ATPase